MKNKLLDIIRKIEFRYDFIVDDINSKEYTYNSFFLECKKIAKIIEEKTSKNTIIVIMENSCRLAMMYFAAIFAKKRIAVIDPQKGKDEILQIVNGMPDFPILCDSSIEDFFPNRIMYVVGMEEYQEITEETIKEEFLNVLESCSAKDPYLITFTSGTSGIAKGVEHSLENLLLTAEALHKKVGVTNATFLHVMPMTYMAGILNSIFYPLLSGAKIVITNRFSVMTARTFWKTVKKYQCNLFWLSPSMLMMIDKLDRNNLGKDYCCSNKTAFLIGTAPLTQETRSRFNKRYGVNVFASYGLSETLFVSIETQRSLMNANENSVGELLEGVNFCIDDSGEMHIDVPWMFLRYTNEDTDKYFDEKHYYKTGDLVEYKNNFLYITGRSKDLIIKGGINISPSRIEMVVERLPEVQEVAVVGVLDSEKEERILCVYTLRDIFKKTKNMDSFIKRTVVENLGKNYTVDFTWQIEEIPRNINGKIAKERIKQLWGQRVDNLVEGSL